MLFVLFYSRFIVGRSFPCSFIRRDRAERERTVSFFFRGWRRSKKSFAFSFAFRHEPWGWSETFFFSFNISSLRFLWELFAIREKFLQSLIVVGFGLEKVLLIYLNRLLAAREETFSELFSSREHLRFFVSFFCFVCPKMEKEEKREREKENLLISQWIIRQKKLFLWRAKRLWNASSQLWTSFLATAKRIKMSSKTFYSLDHRDDGISLCKLSPKRKLQDNTKRDK